MYSVYFNFWIYIYVYIMYIRTIYMMEQHFTDILACDNSFKAAVKALYKLQSNSEYLRLATNSSSPRAVSNLHDTKKYLFRSGITIEKLDSLSVIHVTGTKGKGSACAYTEAILREYGFRTGFFSSPHLVTVRERIRINGQPISEAYFAHYFWKIYKRLNGAKDHEYDMPAYFKFLTVLMFNIFLDEAVDVTIIEVGIGGLYDCTNIVRNPICVGITSLGLDHTSLLGNTLEDIAYQKSGIFKPKTVAFSVPQLPQAMNVLDKAAMERSCTLKIVPPFDTYMWDNFSPILKIAHKVQQQNASLAIQMALEWISKTTKCSKIQHNIVNNMLSKEDRITVQNVFMDKIAIGLSSCIWPGRMQILKCSFADFFLDGAHTIESMQCCISWFTDISCHSKGKRILIFNISGTRDPLKLLTPLKSLQFHEAYFVPNFAGIPNIEDEINYLSIDEQKVKCEVHSKIWGRNSIVLGSVSEVLRDIKSKEQQGNDRCQILVTGSLHLVGATLTILDPNLTMNTQV